MADISEHIEIEAPEHVTFQYELAGIGSRFVAGLLDHLLLAVLWAAAIFGLVLAGASVFDEITLTEQGDIAINWLSASMAVAVLFLFLVTWGYNVFFEVKRGGQTPGKRAMKLRVVKEGGFAVGFWDSLLRNVLRAVDGLPAVLVPTYGLAGLVMVCNRKAKRLGDYVAGTVVIKENPAASPAERPEAGYAAQPEVPLTREELRLARRFLSRLDDLAPERARELASRIAGPAMQRLGRSDEDPLEFLLAILVQRAPERPPEDAQSR